MSTSTRNPDGSMASSWHRWDGKHWNISNQVLQFLGLRPDLYEKAPVHRKTDMVPYATEWRLHVWILVHALIPLVLQQAYITCYHRDLSKAAACVLYSLSSQAIILHQLCILRRAGQICGFFDGDKHERDCVPSGGVWQTTKPIVYAVVLRPLIAIVLTYEANQPPSSIQWIWLPLKITAYTVILDFWYYWLHRIVHENKTLWSFHRTHHLTKHPNPLFTGFSDAAQGFFDTVGIPLIALGSMKLLGVALSFYDLWICQQYVSFTEIAGHSGVRTDASANPMTWLFRMLDVEIVIEDHDLHHRFGSRRSFNYGKQTRIWDRLFGTAGPRVEGYKGNIDYVNAVDMPLW